ncbi:MAG: xanthine dehydrogenase family protein molybdopterin-binding subunit, partial [Limnohabitans sp.]
MNARNELPVSDQIAQSADPIGQSTPRTGARKLLQGRGMYLDDMRVPRLAHVVFFRSPHAHARIKHLDLTAARQQPGVIAAVDGRAIAEFCTPWVGVLTH